MCIIILNPHGVEVNEKIITASMEANPHGIGIYFTDTKKIQRFKSCADKKVYNLLKDRSYIAHFRYSSMGGINNDNIHPFIVNNRYYIFHNGTFAFKDPDDNTISDTRVLAKMLTDMCQSGFNIMGSNFKKMFEMIDKKNKLVIFDKKTGLFVIFNEHIGVWKDGAWFSKEPLQIKGNPYYHDYRTYKKYEYVSSIIDNKTTVL